MTEAERKSEFFTLVNRFNQLGRLLPPDIDTTNIASAQLIIAEMNKTRRKIDALLGPVKQSATVSFPRGATGIRE